MNQTASEQIKQYVRELIAEGESVCNKARTPNTNRPWARYVPIDEFARWSAQCCHLASMLGPVGAQWANTLSSEKPNDAGVALEQLGTLRGVLAVLEKGLLFRVKDLVLAETFSDLLEQAEYLLSENYHLAAGVLGRAVLEEHLRNWCDRENCAPDKPRPTLNDYNQSLYKAEYINKITMKHVESLGAIGNDAAHAEPTLEREAVERLLRDVRELLARPAASS